MSPSATSPSSRAALGAGRGDDDQLDAVARPARRAGGTAARCPSCRCSPRRRGRRRGSAAERARDGRERGRPAAAGRDGHVDVARRARHERRREGVRVEARAGRLPLMPPPVADRDGGALRRAVDRPRSPAIARMICIPRPRCGADGASSQRPWSRISIRVTAVVLARERDDDRRRHGLERVLDRVRGRLADGEQHVAGVARGRARPPASQRRSRSRSGASDVGVGRQPHHERLAARPRAARAPAPRRRPAAPSRASRATSRSASVAAWPGLSAAASASRPSPVSIGSSRRSTSPSV